MFDACLDTCIHFRISLGLPVCLTFVLLAASCSAQSVSGPAKDVSIVAAENFYGDIASQIGGDRVNVISILSNPNADPHEYEPTAEDAKAVGDARIVIVNDLGYDGFMDRLISASPRSDRTVIDVGALSGRKQGDNPHVWYDPTTMPKLAQNLGTALSKLDPAGSDYYSGRLQTFEASMKTIADQIAAVKAKYSGAKVLPTEPVFDDMAEALGLNIVDKEGAFQRAVEEGNDPPAAAVAEFRQQLTSGTIKVLIYNSQAVTPLTSQMQDLAKQNGVAVVAVTETEPAGKNYQQWMLDEIKSVQQALGG